MLYISCLLSCNLRLGRAYDHQNICRAPVRKQPYDQLIHRPSRRCSYISIISESPLTKLFCNSYLSHVYIRNHPTLIHSMIIFSWSIAYRRVSAKYVFFIGLQLLEAGSYKDNQIILTRPQDYLCSCFYVFNLDALKKRQLFTVDEGTNKWQMTTEC